MAWLTVHGWSMVFVVHGLNGYISLLLLFFISFYFPHSPLFFSFFFAFFCFSVFETVQTGQTSSTLRSLTRNCMGPLLSLHSSAFRVFGRNGTSTCKTLGYHFPGVFFIIYLLVFFLPFFMSIFQGSITVNFSPQFLRHFSLI